MLQKRNRNDRKKVASVLRSGESLKTPNLQLKFLLETAGNPQISFIAPKTIAKNSVKRNFLRRRGYHLIQKHLSGLPTGLRGVFIFKRTDANIENDIKEIFNKLNRVLPKKT